MTKIEWRWEKRIEVIRTQIFPAIFYEYTDGIWRKEEALVLLKKWYRTAKNLAPKGTDLRELTEAYKYYKERIKEFEETSERWYLQRYLRDFEEY